MTVELLSAEQVRGQLAELVAPLREQLALVESEIKTVESRLAELRALRTELARAVRTITGEPAKNQNGKPRAKPFSVGTHASVSAAKVEQTLDWLKAHADELTEGFTATEIDRRSDYDIYRSQSQVSAVMTALHRNGLIVLDRRGSGGSKVYKLTPSPSPT